MKMSTTNAKSKANARCGKAADGSAPSAVGKRTSVKTRTVKGTVKSATPVSERGGKKRSVLSIETPEGVVSAQASDGLAREAWLAYEGDAVQLTVEVVAGTLEIHKITFPGLGCQLTQNSKGVVREAPIK